MRHWNKFPKKLRVCYKLNSFTNCYFIEIIQPYFAQFDGKVVFKRYKIDAKCTYSTVSTSALTKEVAALVPRHHLVDLTNPDIVIFVHIVKTSCGISIVDEFATLAQLNINKMKSATMLQQEAQETKEKASNIEVATTANLDTNTPATNTPSITDASTAVEQSTTTDNKQAAADTISTDTEKKKKKHKVVGGIKLF